MVRGSANELLLYLDPGFDSKSQQIFYYSSKYLNMQTIFPLFEGTQEFCGSKTLKYLSTYFALSLLPTRNVLPILRLMKGIIRAHCR